MSDNRIIIGLHPVRELLRAGRKVHDIAVADTRSDSEVFDDLVALAAARRVPVRRIPRDDLDRLAEGLVHQGVVATAPAFAYQELEAVLERAEKAGEVPLLVALDGVTDPHNLGSICRTAEAIGAHAVLVPGRRAVHVTPTAEKAAAGALAHLPVVRIGNLVKTMRALADRPVWSLGLDADASVELASCNLASEPVILVVGAEGKGLARLTRDACDQLVKLPMRGQIASLNASVAAAVALYAIDGVRSKNLRPGGR
jgi:23S rRNA (guanosine2251-2'-O)-methyltransferase